MAVNQQKPCHDCPNLFSVTCVDSQSLPVHTRLHTSPMTFCEKSQHTHTHARTQPVVGEITKRRQTKTDFLNAVNQIFHYTTRDFSYTVLRS